MRGVESKMTEGNIIDDLFDHSIEYRLAICKECQHRVLPSQIKSYLQRAHQIGRKQAKSVAEEVGS
jgi:hypothetical protein